MFLVSRIQHVGLHHESSRSDASFGGLDRPAQLLACAAEKNGVTTPFPMNTATIRFFTLALKNIP